MYKVATNRFVVKEIDKYIGLMWNKGKRKN